MAHPTERLVNLAERTAAHHTGPLTTLTGKIAGSPTPLTIYTNGSVSDRPAARNLGHHTGWGYLATDGSWGCGKTPQFTRAGIDLALVTELRAVYHALTHTAVTRHRTIATTSQHAIKILTDWQDGSTRMPHGYTGSNRRRPTLQRLRHLIADQPTGFTFRQVTGHDDKILHDGADTLALIGLRWGRDRLTDDDARTRAAGTARDFIAQWRTT